MAVATVEETRTSVQRTRSYYMYTLEWPSAEEYHPNEVFYIGKGTKPRLFEHEEEAAKWAKSRKCDVIFRSYLLRKATVGR